MCPVRAAFTLLLATVVAGAVPALAQDAPRNCACTYEMCALHVERTLLSRRVFRGEERRLVDVSGLAAIPSRDEPTFGLTDAVGSPPSALLHARRFERRARRVSFLLDVAVTALLVGAVVDAAGGPDVASRVGTTAYLGLTGAAFT